MIKIQRLTEKDLDIFRNKKIILYGVHGAPLSLCKILGYFGFEITACCIEKMSVGVFLKLKLNGIYIVKPEELELYIKEKKNVILQSTTFDPFEISKIKKIAVNLNVEFSGLSSGAIESSLSHIPFFKQLNNPIRYICSNICWKYLCTRRTSLPWYLYKKEAHTSPIIICSTPKTADYTLVHTFDLLNMETKKVDYFNVWHNPRMIKKNVNKKKFETFKILMGIREPISQNLSTMFQSVSSGNIITDWVYGMLGDVKRKNRDQIIDQYETLFVQNGNDVQLLWDAYIKRYIYPEGEKSMRAILPRSIQAFIKEFNVYIVNILEYPFDKDKGYAIIKEDNIEVFVYQLEKLNSLVPELSAWVGAPFSMLAEGNQAADKWIGEIYRQAQKEIQITQEYFDRCFDEPYVKHCYSDVDIERFKEKWCLHIKNKDV